MNNIQIIKFDVELKNDKFYLGIFLNQTPF